MEDNVKGTGLAEGKCTLHVGKSEYAARIRIRKASDENQPPKFHLRPKGPPSEKGQSAEGTNERLKRSWHRKLLNYFTEGEEAISAAVGKIGRERGKSGSDWMGRVGRAPREAAFEGSVRRSLQRGEKRPGLQEDTVLKNRKESEKKSKRAQR